MIMIRVLITTKHNAKWMWVGTQQHAYLTVRLRNKTFSSVRGHFMVSLWEFMTLGSLQITFYEAWISFACRIGEKSRRPMFENDAKLTHTNIIYIYTLTHKTNVFANEILCMFNIILFHFVCFFSIRLQCLESEAAFSCLQIKKKWTILPCFIS